MSPLVLSRSLFGAVVLAGPLQAEETQVEETVNLGEITVTASKMPETLQEVPQSITVIDDVMLEERRITDVKKVIRQVPNMYTVEGISKTESNVRGLNISVHTFNNPIVLYVDGIPTTNRYGYDIPLVDVERVEVLRGPQGTLYGKDAIGGVINVITRTPGDTWEGNVGGEIGNYEARRATFSANGPIAPDVFYAGVWGSIARDDGWIDNQFPGRDETANDEEIKRVGVNLLLTPTANFSARLHLMHSKDHQGFANGGMVPSINLAPPSISDFERAGRSDFEQANYDVDTFQDTTVDAQGLRLEYNTSLGTFESITTHRTTDVDGRWDVDYAYADPAVDPFRSLVFNNQAYYDVFESEMTSQELRWSHELDSGTRWVAGLYFEREDIDVDNFSIQFFQTDYRFVSENGSESRAVFGQLVLPFLDDFELTLGGRYQRIDKDIDLDYYETPIVNGDVTLGQPVVELKADESWTVFLPKAAVSYRVDDAWTAYASVAKGYMPGGFNYASSSPNVEDAQIEPQESWSYEIGAKASLLDDRLFLSTAAFYMDIEDIHVFAIEENVAVTSNAADANSYGLEIEADFLIDERWKANAALGVINAEYGEYTDSNGNVNDGNKIQRTPSHSINLGLQYKDPSGYYGRVDLVNYGKIYFDAANELKEDPYTLVNLKAGYATHNWEIYAYVDNLTDTDYRTFAQAGAPAGTLVEFGDPREFGLGVKYRF